MQNILKTSNKPPRSSFPKPKIANEQFSKKTLETVKNMMIGKSTENLRNNQLMFNRFSQAFLQFPWLLLCFRRTQILLPLRLLFLLRGASSFLYHERAEFSDLSKLSSNKFKIIENRSFQHFLEIPLESCLRLNLNTRQFNTR